MARREIRDLFDSLVGNGDSNPTRDAIKSAAASMVVGGALLILYAHRIYWAMLLILLGVGVFLFVLLHHPSRFYRLVVWSSIGLLSTLLCIPAIRFSGVFGRIGAVDLIIESMGTAGIVALCAFCCVALGVSAWMDYVHKGKEERPTSVEKMRDPAEPRIRVQQVHSACNSPVIEHAQTVQIVYESGQGPLVGQTPQTTPHAIVDKGPCVWPGFSLPHGGPKVSEPFAGREEELKELALGMSGDRKVVAVVGMPGQGKSCLVGEWYKRGARPPQGVGLFWRKVYEAGYTFDWFIDELHLYLAGQPINRGQIKTVRDRATLVEALLAAKPCWIVLDGVERLFRLWASEPDADARKPTFDDRAGCDPVFDEFLKGAFFWGNGSRLLLTTRAVPSALDENLPLMIGHKQANEKRLTDLKSEEAIGLLDELNVTGTREAKREAVIAYGCHAYAVHVLGILIRDLYGGDVLRWREVNPIGENGLAGLFERVLDAHKDDAFLLAFVACSLGPAPVEMLAKLTIRDEASVRRSLAQLKKWEMVEFDGFKAEQHTIVRQFLMARMSIGTVKARHRRIAAWWAGKKVPVNPTNVDEVRASLHVIEHLVMAEDLREATTVLFTMSFMGDYNIDDWLRISGHLEEGIRVNTLVIEAHARMIDDNGRPLLSIELADCHNSRANAFYAEGRLREAIADYDRAIDITACLVAQDNRAELRNKLARCYTNRGNVLNAQGHLARAVADHERAIEITERLIKQEGHTGLRGYLAGYYNNRALVLAAQGHLSRAIPDYNRAVEIFESLDDHAGCELRRSLAGCYNNRGLALAAEGHLGEAVADHSRAIEILEKLIEQEDRYELRGQLASCYNNRGNAFKAQGRLPEAITDFNQAVDTYNDLVERGGRHELSNDLARCYNNRGTALATQGRLAEAIADYNRAIEIREELTQRRGRHELRKDLGASLFNRATARRRTREWRGVSADVERSAALLRALVEEGQRHVLGPLLETLGFRCRYAKQLRNVPKIAQDANEAMRWCLQEAEQDRTTKPLLKGVALFASGVRYNRVLLSKHGLDKSLWQSFQANLSPEDK